MMKWRSLEESSTGTEDRSLREQFAERKALISQYVPAETQAVHERVVADLKRAGMAERALGVGAQAPAFDLKNQGDAAVRSSDLLAKAKLVICFFRGRWCPFCVGQMEAMNAALPQIDQAGARRHSWLPSVRSEEHTSELQSRQYLVCRLLLEKKKKKQSMTP